MHRLILFFILVFFLSGSGWAQDLFNKQIAKSQGEIKRLKAKLGKTKGKKARNDIQAKINSNQKKINQLKKQLATGKSGTTFLVSIEAEESLGSLEAEEKVVDVFTEQRRPQYEIGGRGGIFCGTTALIGEARFPLRLVLGPATTAVRLSAGLTQDWEMSRRYVPVCLDMIYNFPPDWFSGVENYLGFGLNYVALTTGRVSGSAGGQLLYGIESEGFDGRVFGEIGYGILRTGFSASQKGLTIMAGYRR